MPPRQVNPRHSTKGNHSHFTGWYAALASVLGLILTILTSVSGHPVVSLISLVIFSFATFYLLYKYAEEGTTRKVILTSVGLTIMAFVGGVLLPPSLKPFANQSIATATANPLPAAQVPAPTSAPVSTATSTSEPTLALSPNLVKNGDFERDIKEDGSWESNPITETYWAAGYINRGLCFVQTKLASSSDEWVGVSQKMPVIPGQKYRFSGYWKLDNVNEAHIKIGWLDANGEEIEVPVLSDYGPNASSNWKPVKNDNVTAPVNAESAQLIALFKAKVSSEELKGSFCLDELSLEPIQ